MTNPITALSREDLQFYQDTNPNHDVREMARALLAVMDAKPYGYVHKNVYETCGGAALSSDHEAYVNSTSHIPLYTTPPAPSAPDGWATLPAKLSAENGAKAALSGEFLEVKFISCPECFGDDDCDSCDGSGRVKVEIPVSWTTIKAIWEKGVQHFIAAPAPGGE